MPAVFQRLTEPYMKNEQMLTSRTAPLCELWKGQDALFMQKASARSSPRVTDLASFTPCSITGCDTSARYFVGMAMLVLHRAVSLHSIDDEVLHPIWKRCGILLSTI
jgi:hypothetical protein